MKQKVRVVGVVKTEDGILILKRAKLEPDGAAKWELPTGKIGFGEQPEDAMEGVFETYLGVEVAALTLKDAVTFVVHDEKNQYSNLCIVYAVELMPHVKISPQDRYTAYKFVKEFEGVHLREAAQTVLEIESEKIALHKGSNARDTANSATIYVDGSSRGNPGPSGIGYYIVGAHGEEIEKGGEFIGFATSRVAEYCALKHGVQQAIKLGIKSARFISDSLMVVNQMNGVFKVKNRDIRQTYESIRELSEFFDAVSLSHVPRSQNTVADKEANLAIDAVLEDSEKYDKI